VPGIRLLACLKVPDLLLTQQLGTVTQGVTSAPPAALLLVLEGLEFHVESE
jgi:hypothetical protein